MTLRRARILLIAALGSPPFLLLPDVSGCFAGDSSVVSAEPKCIAVNFQPETSCMPRSYLTEDDGGTYHTYLYDFGWEYGFQRNEGLHSQSKYEFGWDCDISDDSPRDRDMDDDQRRDTNIIFDRNNKCSGLTTWAINTSWTEVDVTVGFGDSEYDIEIGSCEVGGRTDIDTACGGARLSGGEYCDYTATAVATPDGVFSMSGKYNSKVQDDNCDSVQYVTICKAASSSVTTKSVSDLVVGDAVLTVGGHNLTA